MPPDTKDATDSREWLKRARSNLARARAGKVDPDILYEDICFDAQQAAEKAIKAVLVSRGATFRRSHDIIELLTLVDEAGMDVPESLKQADRLTHYAVQTRYPGIAEDIDEEETAKAVSLAGKVLEWAERVIGS